ncbi:MAG TPA: potassium channel family protein [Longimicrobiaceae bacterium]|nr:potassium channel family protein [Longimicrobiaceae bacterium]
MEAKDREARTLDRERWRLLLRLRRWLEGPMVALGFVWLALLVWELVRGAGRGLELLGTAIWAVFVLDFVLRFALAPKKGVFLRHEWLTAVSLFLPALRVFRALRAVRALRAARAVRGVRLVRVVTSLNRGMRSLGRTMQRRGAGYVAALALLVTLGGAAGMLAFERDPGGGGLEDYWEALWWTAMLLTTIGSEYWPRTPEGRALALALSLFSIGIVGYVTAALASFFVGRDAESKEGEVAGEAALRSLRDEVAALREEIRALRDRAG